MARHVDILLYLGANEEVCVGEALRGRLTAMRGVKRVAPVRAGQGRLLRVEHDPAVVRAARLREMCEEAGCPAKLIGL